MMDELARNKLSRTAEEFKERPVLALVSLLVFILFALPALRKELITQEIYDILLIAAYVSLFAIISYYLANKAMNFIYSKSTFKNEPLLREAGLPKKMRPVARFLFAAAFISLLLLVLAALFSIFLDIFTLAYSILKLVLNWGAAEIAFVISIAVFYYLLPRMFSSALKPMKGNGE